MHAPTQAKMDGGTKSRSQGSRPSILKLKALTGSKQICYNASYIQKTEENTTNTEICRKYPRIYIYNK